MGIFNLFGRAALKTENGQGKAKPQGLSQVVLQTYFDVIENLIVQNVIDRK